MVPGFYLSGPQAKTSLVQALICSAPIFKVLIHGETKHSWVQPCLKDNFVQSLECCCYSKGLFDFYITLHYSLTIGQTNIEVSQTIPMTMTDLRISIQSPFLVLILPDWNINLLTIVLPASHSLALPGPYVVQNPFLMNNALITFFYLKHSFLLLFS